MAQKCHKKEESLANIRYLRALTMQHRYMDQVQTLKEIFENNM